MRIKIPYLFLTVSALAFAVFFISSYTVDASSNYNSQSGIRCDWKGDHGTCERSIYTGSHQAWQADYSLSADGHGDFGPKGGNVSLIVCLSPRAAWDGACSTAVQRHDTWIVKGPCGGSSPPEPQSDGKIGDLKNCGFDGRRDIGGNYDSNFDFAYFNLYADDATWKNGTIAAHGRRVSVDDVWCSSNCNPKVGENFTISWNADWATEGTELEWFWFAPDGPGVNPGNSDVDEDGSRTFTCNNVGWTRFLVNARGPSSDGVTLESRSVDVECKEGQPGNFSLTQEDCYWHNNNHASFELRWTQSQNATSYEIWRRAWSNGVWRYRDTVGSNTFSYHAHEGTNTDWYFRIKAKNSAGERDSNIGNDTGCYTPTVDLDANNSDGPITIGYNSSATLNWSSSDADSCSASNGWSGNKPRDGRQSTGNLTSSKTYTLTCSNAGGSRSDSVKVNVNIPPAPVVDLRCNGGNSCGTVRYGEAKTLNWSISNGAPADSCTASGAWSGSKGPSGPESTGSITSDRTWVLSCSGPGGTSPSDSVSATVNPPSVDIRCDNGKGPCNIEWNQSSLIEWCGPSAQPCDDASSCSVTRNGSGWQSGTSGAHSTGVQSPGTYTYGLTCMGDGQSSDSVTVIVNLPVPNNPSNVSVTQPDYCVVGPAATTTWDYSDSSGSPQSAYEVEIDDNVSFNSPEWDSGKVPCGGCRSNSTPQGVLQFNETFRARVRVWNGYDVASGWTTSSPFTTPPHALPDVDFSFAPAAPGQQQIIPNDPVQFTDQTDCYNISNNPVTCSSWFWDFDDTNTSPLQNPQHSFASEGTYNVTETAIDDSGNSCSLTQPVSVQEPNPIWIEVNPGG